MHCKVVDNSPRQYIMVKNSLGWILNIQTMLVRKTSQNLVFLFPTRHNFFVSKLRAGERTNFVKYTLHIVLNFKSPVECLN